MATLVSPGVSVTVTDESFTIGAGPGTVPLIILATEQDKLNSSGDAIAPGTTAAEAGKLKLVSSQRELLQLYGLPNFNEIGGNALHGNPLNEYGLLAAHSYLGIANRAYTLRADIDLAELQPLDDAPTAPPADGTYWLDSGNSDFGLNEWDATLLTWVKQEVFASEVVDSTLGTPLDAPSTATYAVTVGRVETTLGVFISENQFWKNIAGTWTRVETGFGFDMQYSSIYPTLNSALAALVQGDLWVNLNDLTLTTSVYDATVGNFVGEDTPSFSGPNAATAWYGEALRPGDLYAEYNFHPVYESTPTVATYLQEGLRRWNGNTVTNIVSGTAWDGSTALLSSITITSFNDDGTVAIATPITIAAASNAQTAVNDINMALSTAGDTQLTAYWIDAETFGIRNVDGKAFALEGTDVVTAGFEEIVYSTWDALVYEAGAVAPAGDLADGTLWISTEFNVDILKNDGLGGWVEIAGTLYIQPSEPLTPLLDDIWVDTDQLDAYPVISEYTGSEWRVVDNTDQTTPNGIQFQDARPDPDFGTDTGVNNGGGTNPDLDADAPDALAFPAGMLLWNSRYSTRNVKRWTVDYTFEGNLIGDRWVSESGNAIDGALVTGEAAVRKVVVEALQSVIVSNEDIRAESVFYNLVATPGYVETIDEMIGLNIDRKETAFIIGDTPFDLPATGTALQQWSSNYNNVASNGNDGLISADEYLGVYYPSGLSTNLDGTEVVVPPSHMLLRTMAFNDNVAYQWFAPAGLNRGPVTNASSVGYVTSEGEFQPVELNEGLRDILYVNNINPIRTIPNRGINVWGNKTRSPVSSAMDRINVARLMNYIRYQSDQLAMPFLFEPNDSITRSNVKTAYDSFLGGLVTLRGLYDFLVVCDESNNTPDRIDRNELWIDIAIQPVKAIEFIYIPIRIRSTGASLT